MVELRLEGRLEEANLAKLMYSICRAGETGTLYISHGKITASLYISKGQVVFASSNDPNSRLGEILLKHGQISYVQYVEAIGKLKPNKRLGTILVELGYLSAQDLYHYVIEQVKEIIFALFTKTEGAYRFEIGALPSKELITLNISTPDLIIEGLKRIDQWGRIQEGVGGLDAIYELSAGNEERLKGVTLTEGEKRLLESIKTGNTLEKILEKTQFPDIDACRLLWAFQIIGLVNRKDALEAEVGELLGEALAEKKEEGDLTISIRSKKALQPEKVAAEEESEEEEVEEPKPAPSVKAKPVAKPEEEAPSPTSIDLDLLEEPKKEKTAKESPAEAIPFESLEKSVNIFNEKHTYLFSLIKGELGEDVQKFVDSALERVDKKHLLIFDGAKVNDSGAFPKDIIMKNIKGNSIAEYQGGLDALIDTELEKAKEIFKNPARIMILERGLNRISSDK